MFFPRFWPQNSTGKSLSELIFLHQLVSHNMMTACSLNYQFNTWKFQAQTWGEHVVYRHCFWHSPCSAKKELLTKINLYVEFVHILKQRNVCQKLMSCIAAVTYSKALLTQFTQLYLKLSRTLFSDLFYSYIPICSNICLHTLP